MTLFYFGFLLFLCLFEKKNRLKWCQIDSIDPFLKSNNSHQIRMYNQKLGCDEKGTVWLIQSRWAINQSLINKLMKLTSQNAPSRSATSQFVYFKSTKNEIKFHFDADKSYCIETPAAQKTSSKTKTTKTRATTTTTKTAVQSIFIAIHFWKSSFHSNLEKKTNIIPY